MHTISVVTVVQTNSTKYGSVPIRMHTQEEIITRIYELIGSIESQLETVRELVSIAFDEEVTEPTEVQDKISIDAEEVDQEDTKKPAARKLTKEEKRSLLIEARLRAQLWAQDEEKRKKQKRQK
jgi:hypothetical protein